MTRNRSFVWTTVLLTCAWLGVRAGAQDLPIPVGDLAPGTLAADDDFGAAVSVDGAWCAVGAPGDDQLGVDAGAVYVFAWNGSAWTLDAKLLASDGVIGDHFGTSVRVDGDRLVVGSPLNDPQGLLTGAVYVFENVPSIGWQESSKLWPASSLGNPARFGDAVDLSGDVLVVGAPRFVGPASGLIEGRVSIYRWSGSQWVLEFEEPASSLPTERGAAVATDGTRVASLGAAPAIYTYEYVGGAWVEMEPPLVSAGLYPGNQSVAILGDRLFAMTSQSEVTIYAWDGVDWTPGEVLSQPTSALGMGCPDNGGFGHSLQLSGDRLLIGSPCHVDQVGVTSGGAFLYLDTGSGWVPVWESYGSNDLYGTSVGLGDDGLVVGARVSDATAPAAGAGEAYELVPSVSYCTAKPTSIPGCTALMSSTGIPSYNNPDGFTMDAAPAPGGRLGIFFWGRTGPAAVAFNGGTLCVQPPLHRAMPRISSGTPGVCDGAFTLSLGEVAESDPIFTVGVQLYVQAWFRDPGDAAGSALSDGLTFIVGN